MRLFLLQTFKGLESDVQVFSVSVRIASFARRSGRVPN